MRNRNEKGNTMATIDFEHGLTENVDAEDTHNTTWSECECEACTSTPDYEEWPVEADLEWDAHWAAFDDGMW